MFRDGLKIWVVTVLAAGLLGSVASAVVAPPLAVPAGLALAEIKMTGSEFVMLVNNSGSTITDLSQYWLQVFNNANPGAAGVSSSLQQLPAGSLQSGQAVLLSEGGSTCGAAVTDSLGISLSDSSGYLQVIQNTVVSGVLSQLTHDAVSWSSGANATPGMISSVPSNSSDPLNSWYRYQNSLLTPPFLWQKARIASLGDICQLNVVDNVSSAPVTTSTVNQLLPGLPPPATIVSVLSETDESSESGSGGLPAADIGLRSPVLNELLPNPKEPQTDADDEYVELYNPNDATFDLSGFKLQTRSGTSDTKRTYTFPSGTKIAPKSFAAYPSENISVSLSNNGGQVWLLDPKGNIISQTEPYTEAKEGLAWALAEGKWYWTTTPTPNAANTINGSTSGISSSKNKSGSGVGVVEGTKQNASLDSSPTGKKSNSSDNKNPLLHPLIIAGVATAALLYGLYEYRGDIKNKLHQLQQNRATRRARRQKP
ncbi:hypothetical protein A3D14_03420 [Candidatus Saccharibacteria bacterium RIFCSPHIGHO2_02_FULL_47_12]|nr:MAG: hypothetical protein A3D14_03420 [Candidatus Saccharibacteria bacterium RIFCSPHIGHO2_02_FULL_47_12]